MEAILLIIGELVFAILAPFVAIVVEAVGAAISALAALLWGGAADTQRSSTIPRRIALAFTALAGLVLACVLVANFFFFEASVRYVLDKVERRTGIVTRCEAVDGSLLTGQISLVKCSIDRPEHATTAFKLDVEQVGIDLRITSMLGTATIDTARVAGLSGWVRADRGGSGAADEATTGERPRRRFEVMDLAVSDVRVTLSGSNADGNRFEVPVAIDRLQISPLRSRYALFDILFRANGSGTLADAPFRVTTSSIPDGRRTEWRAERVPIASFGAMTGGVLAWFSAGTVDVHVDDEWQRDEATAIDLDWRLNFSGVEVTPPPGTGKVARFVTAPLTGFVNRFDGEFPLEFALVLNENQFEYRSSLAAAGLWNAIADAANKALKAVGIDLGAAEEAGESIKDGMKSILDRARRREAPDPD